MSDKKIDRASDVEFSQAIADAIPADERKTNVIAIMGAAYLAGKVIKRAKKKK